MAAEAIPCLPLKTLTDGPLFGAPEGTLSALQNMNILPGGYAEARGGMEKLQPLGGTPADPLSAGQVSSVHQVNTSYAWVRNFDNNAAVGSQYGANFQLHPGGWEPFPSTIVGDYVLLGADLPFSRIYARIIEAGAWAAAAFVYEYSTGQGTWGTLTTAETIDWTNVTTDFQFASWTMPTDWVAATTGDAGTGNVLKYWIRIRPTSYTAPTNNPKVSFMYGYWVGMRELFTATQSPRTSATAGTLKRHGQSTTTEEWFTVAAAAGTMFSGNASPARMASYRGRLYLVNEKESKRFDGATFTDIGLTKPDLSTLTVTLTPNAAAGMGAGIWRYYVAYGYGPTQNPSRVHPHDAGPLYGVSQAVYAGEAITTGLLPSVDVAYTGAIPAEISSIHLYRTQDLTGVASVGERATFPAFLVDSNRRVTIGLNPVFALEAIGTAFGGVLDNNLGPLFPNIEAIAYDNLPPKDVKFVTVYQNRLLLGTSDVWYWSDAFQPDVFNRSINFIQLARATGGRHMGGLEFADQVMLWTEEQTWGLTNIDLDIPQLYPIHPTVGCVAPDAAAAGDGLAIWPARDGFYAWNGGKGLPIKISSDMDQTFGNLSYETIGGSTATIHDQKYDIRLASPDNSTIGDAWRFDMQTGTWSKLVPAGFTSTLFPITSIHAPLGNRDPGGLHAVWAKRDYGTGAGDYSLFLEGLTTQDNGNNFTCSATMHFPVPPNRLFAPNRVLAYYSASDGWGTPTMSFATSSVIGSDVGALTAGTPDTADDYSILGGTFAESNRGTSDLKVTFSVASAAGGTPMRQRFYGAIIEGVKKGVRRGMV